MSSNVDFAEQRIVVDSRDNQHLLASELARGGQGVVYRTEDSDLAIKLQLGGFSRDEDISEVMLRYQLIRSLPIPNDLSISLPLVVLRDEPGYVMNLLNEMDSLHAHFDAPLMMPEGRLVESSQWIQQQPFSSAVLQLLQHANTGSTKRRLFVFAEIASILGQLHARGIVYGDLSPRNCFVGHGDRPKVALIDADNMRYEQLTGGITVYTPGFGAPEIIRGDDSSRTRTDIWSFAVLAFASLTMKHPFKGLIVDDQNREFGGWDAPSQPNQIPVNADELAANCMLPFIDDLEDRTNKSDEGIDREIVLTTELRTLFQETLGVGRNKPWRRAGAYFFAREMFRACDQSIYCEECKMSYFRSNRACPYCSRKRSSHVVFETEHWSLAVEKSQIQVSLPYRLCGPFQLQNANETICEVFVDFESGSVNLVRGSDPLPPNVHVRFQE